MSLVTTDWVLENLNSLKIIDASWHMPAQKRNPAEEYLNAHIPNSVFFDLDENSQKDTDLPHMLVDKSDWEKIVSEIKKIYDPEIPVNIFELGLIYKIEVNENKKVLIEMTLTSPNCPVAESLPNSVKENILKIEEVEDVDLKLVWDPPWTKDKMTEAAKLELNL